MTIENWHSLQAKKIKEYINLLLIFFEPMTIENRHSLQAKKIKEYINGKT